MSQIIPDINKADNPTQQIKLLLDYLSKEFEADNFDINKYKGNVPNVNPYLITEATDKMRERKRIR